MIDIQERFIKKSKELIIQHSEVALSLEDIFVVWSCKTLQNSKALLGTSRQDGKYYECTYDGEMERIYFDIYKKELKKIVEVDL